MERNFTLVVLFGALLCVLGFVPPIPLSFGVPIAAQSLGVMLAGAVLGPVRGALAVLLWLGLAAIGLPVLAGGRGGLGVFFGPSAGFLFGYAPAAFVTGLVVQRLRSLHVGIAAVIGAVLGGIVVLYGFGVLGMMIVLKKSFADVCVLLLPFIPGDVLKAALTGWLTAAIARYRPGALLSRID